MTSPWTPEEWERRRTSVLEDARILQAEINELLADAEFLRERGHQLPAARLVAAVAKAQKLVDDIVEQLG